MTFPLTPERVWNQLLYFEQIAERPPLTLRLLLPRPLKTEGDRWHVGDKTTCSYETGHIIKRVTQTDPLHRHDFDVVEQTMDVGAGMKLLGGSYALKELSNGRTEVELTTRYVSPKRPRWMWRPIEAAVCHRFHQHILNSMRRQIGLTSQ